ncbi:MAG: ParA family protein [Spirochaetota bacterium]
MDKNAIVISVGNQKGGVGKTTSIIACARAAVQKGARVLVIDMDANALATAIMSGGRDFPDGNTLHFLKGGGKKNIVRAEALGIDFVPSHNALTAFDTERGNAGKLNRALDSVITRSGVRSEYDYIFIDTPSTVGRSLMNALIAATIVLIPVCIDYLSLQGVTKIVNTIRAAERELGRTIAYFFFVTRYMETSESREVLGMLTQKLRGSLLKTVISYDEVFSQSIALGKTAAVENFARYDTILSAVTGILGRTSPREGA